MKQNSEQKVLVNQKHRVSRQKSFNIFLGKTFIQILYVYILRNTKPCQTQLILNCVLLSEMCINHPKILTFLKLISALGVFGLKCFHRFVVLGGRIGRISCLVFCLVIKMWKNLYKKSYQTWQKTSKCSNRTQKKRQILFHKFLCEYMLFLPPPFVEWGEMKIPKNWVGGGIRANLEGREKI